METSKTFSSVETLDEAYQKAFKTAMNCCQLSLIPKVGGSANFSNTMAFGYQVKVTKWLIHLRIWQLVCIYFVK
ncbi:hypothetical protein E1A91_D03G044700v1 [Gossypium mustelinum]|uniref:Uncharacterized protein n=1 Tax=Gossypium mustelinum TaxID=34275 RepID=A0A5D2VIM5_GOSMU|nr:hypothetical protein E1A91_D03G044700v1 [Gossypium mustelinum]